MNGIKKSLTILVVMLVAMTILTLRSQPVTAAVVTDITMKFSVYDNATNTWLDADSATYIKKATMNGADTRSLHLGIGDPVTISITPAAGYMFSALKAGESYSPWNVLSDYSQSIDPLTGTCTISFTASSGAMNDLSISLQEAVKVTYNLNGGTTGNDWGGNNRIESKGTVITSIGYEFDKITAPAGMELDYVEIKDGSGTHKVTADKLHSTGYSFDSDVIFKCVWKTIGGIVKKTNPLKIKAKNATVKYKKLKKKTQTLKVTKVIKFINKGKGNRTYKLAGVTKAKYKKYFKINKNTGKLTIKKGLKKGTYKVKIKVKASGNSGYKPSEKTVTSKIKVK